MKKELFQPRILHNFLTNNAREFPEKEALIFGKQRLTYSDLDVQSNQLAESLMELGLQRHERVIIFLDNSVETAVSVWGILKAGSAFVVLNSSIKPIKLEYIIKDSGAKIIIAHSKKQDIVGKAVENIKGDFKIVYVNSAAVKKDESHLPVFDYSELLGSKAAVPSKELTERMESVIDYDLAALIYTSGSTGEPKGVISSHFNMISAARSIIEYLANEFDDIILNVLPLSFDYGLYQMIMCVLFGGTMVLETSFMFPVKILQKIEEEKVTGFPIVPTIIALLLKMREIEKYKLDTVRYISNTGAAFPVPHIQKFNELFPHIKIYSMFGLTECKRIAYLPPDQIKIRPDSVGKAMPNCEVFIMDDEGNEIPNGQVGELVVRGSNVMRGYWNAHELTDKVYRKGKLQGETLLYTGDLFRKDEEGYLYFLGRKDDMIKSKGERISPKEIENILCSIKGVAEAAVIGVPDEVFGQAIKAYIVKNDSQPVDTNSILQYCSENMETFMVPKYVEFINELPKSPNGKVDKKILKAELINV